ncbi:hypothetical protein KSP40_PGU010801 [Platanthera guangdongensis]|uniref:Uncharacterized protein n=1 Tax=Platanthera guangdongensis TaxID=2320717 RepID=A0ABR2M8W9_9ASPA
MEKDLGEDERRALRGSKFAPLSVLPSRILPRLAHPNGPMATNKAAALAKFLERKLQQPGGLNSIDPNLLELAVKNAKETVNASNVAKPGLNISHLGSYDSSSVVSSPIVIPVSGLSSDDSPTSYGLTHNKLVSEHE